MKCLSPRLLLLTAALCAFASQAAHAESLRAALTAAYAHNPSINAALFSVKVAAENIALKKATTLPDLSATTSLENSFTSTSAGSSNTPTASAGLSYSQTLFDNHKTDANVEEARANVEVANQSLRSTISTVLIDAVDAYMNVILYTELVRLRTQSVDFYRKQVAAAQDKQQIGEATKVDVAQAQSSLASAIASQKSAAASLQSAQASYVQWIGHKPNDLSSDFNFGTLIPTTVDKALSLANSYNPSILSAGASIRAAQAAEDAAAAGFGPTVTASGSLGPSFCAGSTSSCSYNAALEGSATVQFSVPIYSGGALGAAQRQAGLSTIKSQLDARSAIDQVNEDTATSWNSLQNAISQIQSAEAAVQYSQLSLGGVIDERDVGEKTTLDVLNAEATLETNQESLVTANVTKVTASFALIASTGRMSPRDLGLSSPPKSAQRYTETVEDTWEEVRSFGKQGAPE